jgi:hypothetical protein
MHFLGAVPSASGRSNSRPRGSDMRTLVYAPALTFFTPTPEGLRTQLASLNAAVILLYASLVWLDSAKPRLILDVIRDWLPLGMILLAYREMGWFALPHSSAELERGWVVWDRLVLAHGGRSVIECLGPVVPSVLEAAYALVYHSRRSLSRFYTCASAGRWRTGSSPSCCLRSCYATRNSPSGRPTRLVSCSPAWIFRPTIRCSGASTCGCSAAMVSTPVFSPVRTWPLHSRLHSASALRCRRASGYTGSCS